MGFEKKALTSAGLISSSDFISRCLGFISLPILTTLLAPSEYGVVALIASIVAFGSSISIFGIDLGYSRLYLANKGDLNAMAIENYSWIFILRNAFFCGVFLCILWYQFGSNFIENNSFFLAVYIFWMVFLSTLQIMLQTRARLLEEYKRIAITKVFASICSICLSIYLAIFVFQSFWALLFGSMILSLVIVLSLRPPNISFAQSSISNDNKNELRKLGYINFITALMYWFISSSDRWFISFYEDQSTVGIYSLATNISAISLVLGGGITLAWMPEASRAYHGKGKFKETELGKIIERFMMILLIIWLGVTLSGSEILMLLSNERFHDGIVFIPILAGGFFFYGLATVLNTAQMLKIKLRSVVIFYILGAGLNIILNFIFVPKFGALGAAYSQLLSFGFIATGIFLYSRRIMLIPLRWIRLSIMIIIALISGVFLKQPLVESILSSLLIKFPIGVLLTTLFISFISPDWFNALTKKIANNSK